MTPQATFQLSEIGQIAVPVSDLARAVLFYRDALGLRFLFQAAPGLAFFDCAGVRLMLSGEQPAAYWKDNTSVTLLQTVSANGRVATEMRSVVVKFQDEPHLIHKDVDYELWMAFFQDPEDNTLAIMNEIPT